MQAVGKWKGDLQFPVVLCSEDLQCYEACSYKQLTKKKKEKEKTHTKKLYHKYFLHWKDSNFVISRKKIWFSSGIFIWLTKPRRLYIKRFLDVKKEVELKTTGILLLYFENQYYTVSYVLKCHYKVKLWTMSCCVNIPILFVCLYCKAAPWQSCLLGGAGTSLTWDFTSFLVSRSEPSIFKISLSICVPFFKNKINHSGTWWHSDNTTFLLNSEYHNR